MPGMSGLEAIRKIKRLYEKKVKGKKLPVIVITGYSGEDVDKQSADLGIVDLLYKPFELNEFIKLIKRNLEHVPIYKRAHPRISSSFRVYVKEGDLSDASTDIKGRALNLSEGGVCLSAKEKLHKEEEPVWLHIVPPHSKLRIETKGKVIWAKLTDENKFRYGLQFLNITARDYDMLRQILSQYKRLNPMFVELTNELHDFLQKTKDIFDKFNNSEPSEKEQVNFIMKHRDAVD